MSVEKLQTPSSKSQRSSKAESTKAANISRMLGLGIWSFARIAAARGGEVAQAAFHSAVAVCR